LVRKTGVLWGNFYKPKGVQVGGKEGVLGQRRSTGGLSQQIPSQRSVVKTKGVRSLFGCKTRNYRCQERPYQRKLATWSMSQNLGPSTPQIVNIGGSTAVSVRGRHDGDNHESGGKKKGKFGEKKCQSEPMTKKKQKK